MDRASGLSWRVVVERNRPFDPRLVCGSPLERNDPERYIEGREPGVGRPLIGHTLGEWRANGKALYSSAARRV